MLDGAAQPHRPSILPIRQIVGAITHAAASIAMMMS
jgi:hypothetical protein